MVEFSPLFLIPLGLSTDSIFIPDQIRVSVSQTYMFIWLFNKENTLLASFLAFFSSMIDTRTVKLVRWCMFSPFESFINNASSLGDAQWMNEWISEWMNDQSWRDHKPRPKTNHTGPKGFPWAYYSPYCAIMITSTGWALWSIMPFNLRRGAVAFSPS